MSFDVFDTKWAYGMFKGKYAFNEAETWAGLAKRVAWSVCGGVVPDAITTEIEGAIARREFIPAGRYLYSAGRPFHQVNNCFLFRAEDSREGWADVVHKSTAALMTGGGIGVDYTPVRPFGYLVKRTGGFATGPISLANMVNENGRYVMQGGQRRSAIWGGLHWWHPDLYPRTAKDGSGHPGWLFIKNWATQLRQAKLADLTFPLPMELTNISVIYDTTFFEVMEGSTDAVRGFLAPWGEMLYIGKELAEKVWMANCRQRLHGGHERARQRQVQPRHGVAQPHPGHRAPSPHGAPRCDLPSLRRALLASTHQEDRRSREDEQPHRARARRLPRVAPDA
jgi:hypothetical protein